ncbi:MAG: hypothetical protein L6Q97_25830, partial [Thermoanaerobaculia bacterium]|nr:hypothetical protein [Thermoanaerobaculia bacterium]
MTKKLLITFHPADYYFFGGEETFDVDTVPGVRNYLVRSNRLPQQTAIVGLLRHILFLNNRNIGASSFQADWQADNPQEFGDLIRISPLFLQFGKGQNRHFLIPAPKVFLAGGSEISIGFQQS